MMANNIFFDLPLEEGGDPWWPARRSMQYWQIKVAISYADMLQQKTSLENFILNDLQRIFTLEIDDIQHSTIDDKIQTWFFYPLHYGLFHKY